MPRLPLCILAHAERAPRRLRQNFEIIPLAGYLAVGSQCVSYHPDILQTLDTHSAQMETVYVCVQMTLASYSWSIAIYIYAQKYDGSRCKLAHFVILFL